MMVKCWSLKEKWQTLTALSSALLCSVLVCLQVLGVHLNKWTLDWRLGLACLILYAIFLSFSILIEFNVFIFVNLPMCRDIHWPRCRPASAPSSATLGGIFAWIQVSWKSLSIYHDWVGKWRSLPSISGTTSKGEEIRLKGIFSSKGSGGWSKLNCV